MANNDATGDNAGQGNLDLQVMADALGISKEQLVQDFLQKAASDESTRAITLEESAVVSAGMSVEESALVKEVAKVKADALRNRIFTEPQPIPESWLAKMTEWFDAGLMPPATVLIALGWLSLNDKVSTEATFGRFFDGIGNMVTYPSRLANARRRAFIPDAKKFGPTTIRLNGKTWVGAEQLKQFLTKECGVVLPSSYSLATYLYRAVRDKKVPAGTLIHCLGIPGCTADGTGVEMTRYWEWYTNHRADVSNGVILSKDGEMVEITDYQAEHPPEPSPEGNEGDGEDDGEDC